jgi:hypothetical protein
MSVAGVQRALRRWQKPAFGEPEVVDIDELTEASWSPWNWPTWTF